MEITFHLLHDALFFDGNKASSFFPAMETDSCEVVDVKISENVRVFSWGKCSASLSQLSRPIISLLRFVCIMREALMSADKMCEMRATE